VKCDKMPVVPQVCPRCQSRYHDEAIFCQVDGVRLVMEEEEPDPYLGTELLGQFRIEEILGEGGMGRVYRAHQANLDRNVAVKVLHRELAQNNPDATRRFHREARVTTALDHPNVVNVFMFGEMPDSSPYLVMEYLDGVPLQVLLEREGRLSKPRALHIAIQIAEGVGQAHESGIVHRDVKPENVLIVKRGADENFVKVLDFGIARLLWDKETVATKAGLVFGTARYISPEGASGDPTDARSDVYSIAVLTYQLLCGELPFEGDSAVNLLLAHVNERPPDIRDRCEGLPESIAEVVMRSLSKNPGKRPEDARAYADALQMASEDAGLSQAQRRSRRATPVLTPAPSPNPPVTLAARPMAVARRAQLAASPSEVTSIPGLRSRSFGRLLAISMLMVMAFLVGAGAVVGGAWIAGAFDLRGTQDAVPATDDVQAPPDAASEGAAPGFENAMVEASRPPGVYLMPDEPRLGQPIILVAVLDSDVTVSELTTAHFRVYRRGRQFGGEVRAFRGEGGHWVGSYIFRRDGDYDVRFHLDSERPTAVSTGVELRGRGPRRSGSSTEFVIPVSRRTVPGVSSRRSSSMESGLVAGPGPLSPTSGVELPDRQSPSEPPARVERPDREPPPLANSAEVPSLPEPGPAEPWPGAGVSDPWVDRSGGAIL
jgi:serine/threonine protein kinase